MSVEREPAPQFNFPWLHDEHGDYMIFRSESGDFNLRPETTRMYLFPDQPQADHIFIFTHEQDDMVMGARIWRETLDDALGDGAFGALCDQLFERGFDCADDEEPSELDIKAWEQSFGREYERPDPFEKIVALAIANLDAEWAYYSQEPGWQPES